VQEGNWGYRFIEKSSVDKYGLSSTADLGVGISKLIMENLNMSLQATNGEGYKKPQGDKYHKISFNATYGTRNLNTSNGYNAGVVYSTESTDSDPTRMISTFGGISKMRLRVGAEYDIYTKAGNYEANIISISSNYAVTEKIAAYVRYDMWDDNHAEEKNGKYYLLFGVLINCSNGLSVSPNMKLAYYEDSSISSGNEYKVNFKFQF